MTEKKKRKAEKGKKLTHSKEVSSRTITYPDKHCLCCGTKMKRRGATRRYLTQLNERIRVFAEIYSCPNESCQMYDKKLKPTEFLNIIFPEYSYGIDVLAKVGFLRFKEQRNIPEIHQIILKEHPHIEISERHIENLVKAFMLSLEVSKQDPSYLKEKLNSSLKGLSLSLDGIEPEKGHDILYIVREIQSGVILLATYLEFSDEESIKEAITEPMKKLAQEINLPVLGWIVDKQLALTKAIESTFPGLPIQHCQSHFLKALNTPVREKDSLVSKEVKKTFEDLKVLNAELKKKRRSRIKKV